MIDWKGKAVTVPARRKGAGVARRTLPLSDAGVKALERFDALDCWGSFSNSSMLKSFRRACKAANIIPAPRVYDLRHSFATEMRKLTGDPQRRHNCSMHSATSHMMDCYTLGGVQPRVLVAVDAFIAARGKRLAVSAGSETTEEKQTA